MTRRLVEAHYFEHRSTATPAKIRFWLRELRTPTLLVEVAQPRTALTRRLAAKRPLLVHALTGRLDELEQALRDEEMYEREQDRLYWAPLRRDLEELRRGKVLS